MKRELDPRAFVLPRPRPVPARQYAHVLAGYTGWTPDFGLVVEETTQLMSQATIYVPKDGWCFVVEDDPRRQDWFVSKLGSRIYGFFDQPEVAIQHLLTIKDSDKPYGLKRMYAFFLDHDLGGPYQPPYATDIAKTMFELDPKIGLRTVIHSMNEPGARNLQRILPGAAYFPFGFFDIEDSK